jgi:hypothetical protein
MLTDRSSCLRHGGTSPARRRGALRIDAGVNAVEPIVMATGAVQLYIGLRSSLPTPLRSSIRTSRGSGLSPRRSPWSVGRTRFAWWVPRDRAVSH